MLAIQLLYLALFIYITYTNEYTRMEEKFMAVTLVHQEWCPQFTGISLCNSSRDVTKVDVNKTRLRRSASNPNTDNAVEGKFGTGCCGYCDCKADCYAYGSCCPEMYTSFEAAKTAVDNSRFACVTPKYISGRDKTDFVTINGLDDVWMISKCKPEARYLDQKIIDKCLHPVSNDTLSSLIPVTDGVLHYRNKYCGLCNGKDFSKLTNWKIQIACHNLIDAEIDSMEFLQIITEQRCNVFYKPPKNLPTYKCKIPAYSISKCNESGHWLEYNETIDRACDSFLDPFNLTYKNYFCYFCNRNASEETTPEYMKCKAKEDMSEVTPPFSALMGVGDVFEDEQDEELNCDVLHQFTDDKMSICRDIHCEPDRYLAGFECLIKQDHVIRKCYHLFVKITVSQGQVHSALFNDVTNLVQTVKRVLELMSLNIMSLINFIMYEKINESTFLVDFAVVELVLKSESTPEIDIEANILRNIPGNSYAKDGVTYVTELVSEYVKEFVYLRNIVEPVEMLRIRLSNLSLSDLLPPYRSVLFQIDNNDEYSCLPNTSVPYYKMRVCPYLKLGLDEWDFEIENETLRIGKGLIDQSYTKWVYDITETGIIICLDEFQSIYESLPSRISPKQKLDTISTKRILAFICTILSLGSLFVTIVVYLLLPKLQSQPGINNVILCVCLFLAQSLYQFGAGQTSLSYWECSTIGAFSHLFWLSVMFSMNSCSVQMFLIFKSSTKLTPKFSMKHTLKYVSYVVLASLVFVVINVTVSVIKSSGDESGYGGNVCYISSYIMNVLTFILPTGCTVIVNIVLFTYVVCKIQKSSASSTKMNLERNYFGVYARLSTLTGLTWIFGFILLFVQSDVCEYLFIIFNASQGLFIMIAFILNQRVISLCCGEKGAIRTSIVTISSKKSGSTGSTTDSNAGYVSEPEPQPSTSYAYYDRP